MNPNSKNRLSRCLSAFFWLQLLGLSPFTWAQEPGMAWRPIYVDAKTIDTNLPFMIVKSAWLTAALSETITKLEVYDRSVAGRFAYPQSLGTVLDASISVRGSSSRTFNKKSWALDILEPNLSDSLDVPLLGLPEHSDWIINGPSVDYSLMRNVLAYELAREMGDYAPRTKFMEFYFDDGSGLLRYAGIHVLTEQIKRSKNRLDLKKNKSDEFDATTYHGSYIFRVDRLDDKKYTFTTNVLTNPGPTYSVVYPKLDAIPLAAFDWLPHYLSQALEAIKGASDQRQAYSQFIDTPSFIHGFLLHLISLNPDGLFLSQYFNKDRDGKLRMGPAWDFNMAFDNNIFWENAVPPENPTDDFVVIGKWFNALFKDQGFALALQQDYASFRQSVLSDRNIRYLIESNRQQLAERQRDNMIANGTQRGRVRPPQQDNDLDILFRAEVDYLQNWLLKRLAYLDRAFRCETEVKLQICATLRQ